MLEEELRKTTDELMELRTKLDYICCERDDYLKQLELTQNQLLENRCDLEGNMGGQSSSLGLRETSLQEELDNLRQKLSCDQCEIAKLKKHIECIKAGCTKSSSTDKEDPGELRRDNITLSLEVRRLRDIIDQKNFVVQESLDCCNQKELEAQEMRRYIEEIGRTQNSSFNNCSQNPQFLFQESITPEKGLLKPEDKDKLTTLDQDDLMGKSNQETEKKDGTSFRRPMQYIQERDTVPHSPNQGPRSDECLECRDDS